MKMKKNYNFKENNSSSDNEEIINYDTEFYNQKDRNKRRYETNMKNKNKRYLKEDEWA